jgi:dCTP deaminase
MVLNDNEIYERNIVADGFTKGGNRVGELSRGLSSYGYDATLGNTFRILKAPTPGEPTPVINPKNFPEELFVSLEVPDHEPVEVPPNSFLLATTKETFRIPRDVLAICYGKSTVARCGIIVNVTPLEPEWVGKITIEISNTTPYPALVFPGEGIMQVVFHTAANPCIQSYADKKGVYQNQTDVTLPRVYGVSARPPAMENALSVDVGAMEAGVDVASEPDATSAGVEVDGRVWLVGQPQKPSEGITINVE